MDEWSRAWSEMRDECSGAAPQPPDPGDEYGAWLEVTAMLSADDAEAEVEELEPRS